MVPYFQSDLFETRWYRKLGRRWCGSLFM